MTRLPARRALVTLALALAARPLAAQDATADAQRLVGALLGDTPLLRDLAWLTDRIGGRATGSPANARAVAWALDAFREAGVPARTERFRMPSLWLERSASAVIAGPGIRFAPRVASMPYSVATPPSGTTAPLVDAGPGADADFARLGAAARGAYLLVEQPELTDIDGLFREYNATTLIEGRARAAGALGVVYMSSRPNDLLYRHNVAVREDNRSPMLVMESDGARRALRLLRQGVPLTLTATIALETGGPYDAENVIGEIRGSTRPDEVVLIGAHLDSWDLGDGALDNGANAALVLDVARQVARLGLRPARTIRFALWNGEEQEMVGSAGYVERHAGELDRHAMTASFDIGCGRISGFFTNGRADLVALVDRALEPVAGLGPFQQVNAPVVGTDNFDFMLAGVPNLVANQEPASYGPNYHARSDTFDKCDPRQLRLNAAVAAALTWRFANDLPRLPRHGRAEVEELMRTTDLPQQMKDFNLWGEWERGTRGARR